MYYRSCVSWKMNNYSPWGDTLSKMQSSWILQCGIAVWTTMIKGRAFLSPTGVKVKREARTALIRLMSGASNFWASFYFLCFDEINTIWWGLLSTIKSNSGINQLHTPWFKVGLPQHNVIWKEWILRNKLTGFSLPLFLFGNLSSLKPWWIR